MKVTAVILAAGQGTRMRSALPKVLHPLGGRPLLQYSLDLAAKVGSASPVVVVGHGADQVRETVGDKARFAVQEQQLGTANAVQSAAAVAAGEADYVVVISADMPLLRSETLQELVNRQASNDGPLTMLTVKSENPRGFGRVVRGADGSVTAIVEEAQATPEQLAIRELNAGAYCFRDAWLWPALRRVNMSPKGEYYLTDLVEIAVAEGQVVQALVAEDKCETIGINTRVHLSEAETALRSRINTAWMESGVTMIDPATTYIDASVQIGRDTVIWPNTCLYGETVIGEGCEIGPNTMIHDTLIGNRCKVFASVLEKAELEDGVDMGPFARLRKGAHLAEGVHMGNFGEVKDSYLGPGTKMGHFSYIGNANIGNEVNIGAGTITCNYDGKHKHQTEIGDHVFIGSDTMLVAPVKIGARARTGAGAVVTRDIAADTTVVGVPARPLYKSKEKDGN
ncbi:MAG: bifunctional UDP-N-acetylglucosamine diphosphorylase/glucosamine-1-phosphate N-acetyltransferase GlmU [Anaerolineaceae bacterium]|nr:bifunctional UDP-N-acetylglucosamine diphosphorylase/glucosamine-1-phosphate N-acetyltransferase GlmU [Anaerolineaceae bacterium]